VAQAVEHLPSKQEALNSNSSTVKKQLLNTKDWGHDSSVELLPSKSEALSANPLSKLKQKQTPNTFLACIPLERL
jgi:hypothetical protein